MAVASHPVLGEPIDARDLFAPERARLLELLAALDDAAWHAPTPCPGWSVHDIALHLLGADIGRLSRTRDRFTGVAPSDEESFSQFIDRIHQEWLVAARRMSPRLLRSALAWTGEQVAELWAEMPPDESGEPVSWAGPDSAPVWLDAAREFTEYWVHRQQLQIALDRSPPEAPATLQIVIDTFLRALPHTLRHQQRPVGATFSFVVPEPVGGTWTVERHPDGWALAQQPRSPNAVVLGAAETWRLCVRMLEPQTARKRAQISGDRELASAALTIVAIIRSD